MPVSSGRRKDVTQADSALYAACKNKFLRCALYRTSRALTQKVSLQTKSFHEYPTRESCKNKRKPPPKSASRKRRGRGKKMDRKRDGHEMNLVRSVTGKTHSNKKRATI
ncbi:hypothetical protein CEXT_793291 [Caerostris extrusa]|uniref:Uncharacterized protein n=1 Tax=Caerostris extrusa TaxID=172846 RepID=A0AAV4SSA8_CAEEX|nr:hypothetical protein CEXT_793291 [Caerostris extrusa]